MSLRRALEALLGVAVVVSAAVLVGSALSTSSARVSASTETSGFFASGEISLDRPNSSADLLFDAGQLFPGVIVSGCTVVDYTGSLPADVRLHGELGGGTGLENYVELTLAIDRTGQCPIEGVPMNLAQANDSRDTEQVIFDGIMVDLWVRHGAYASGIVIDDDVKSGDRIAIIGTAVLVDDNEAQGRETEFIITIEARP